VTTGIRNIEKSKTVLVLSPVFYAQFGEGVSPGRVNRALKNMGFLDAVDEFEALETFSTALEIYLNETQQFPVKKLHESFLKKIEKSAT
jgi:hypothetical protein